MCSVDKHAAYDKKKLMLLSVIALATAGMAFSIRGATLASMQAHFFDVSDQAMEYRLINLGLRRQV